MMTVSSSALEDLKRTRPEWGPWLTVLEMVARECTAPHWDQVVPAPVIHGDGRPLLAGASIALPNANVHRPLERLLRLAALSDSEAMRSLAAVRPTEADGIELFTASLRHDVATVTAAAAAHGADADALQAVIALLPVPFLQACNRAFASSIPAAWTRGYCAVCGSWPTFVEMRGIERSRYCRCARCGGEWQSRTLVCLFCGMSDHEQLATLVPAKGDAHAVVEACNGCRAYVKAFTRLQGCPPAMVMIEDLASVELDMAAIDLGYTRPEGAGHSIDATVTDPGPRRRGFFGWRA